MSSTTISHRCLRSLLLRQQQRHSQRFGHVPTSRRSLTFLSHSVTRTIGASLGLHGARSLNPAGLGGYGVFSSHRTRDFHSSPSLPSSSNAARDTRLAGRKRFYDAVGTAEAQAPWEDEEDDFVSAVESPISAGVDGTQSASGVALMPPDPSGEHSTSTRAERVRLLTPLRDLTGSGGDGNVNESEDDAAPISWHAVTLDGRPLRTPLGRTLRVPSLPLAMALAAEWDAQLEYITPAQMPLTTLVCTALDQTALDPGTAVERCMSFLRNDTTCYRADPGDDRVLRRRQDRHWSDLHDWVVAEVGTGGGLGWSGRPALAVGAGEAIIRRRPGGYGMNAGTSGFGGLPHPTGLVDDALEFVSGLDAWHLTALQCASSESKSLLVGVGLLCGFFDGRGGGRVSGSVSSSDVPLLAGSDHAVAAARVEEEFQIENWGLVEGGHDYDRLNCQVQMASAAFLVSAIRP